jgi:hypothetical protein
VDRCLGRRPVAVITGKHRPSTGQGAGIHRAYRVTARALAWHLPLSARGRVLAARAGLRQGHGQEQLALSHLDLPGPASSPCRDLECFNRLPALPRDDSTPRMPEQIQRGRDGLRPVFHVRAMLMGKVRLQSGGDLFSRAPARQQLAATVPGRAEGVWAGPSAGLTGNILRRCKPSGQPGGRATHWARYSCSPSRSISSICVCR